MELDKLIEKSIIKCKELLAKNSFLEAKLISYQTIKVNPECHDAYMVLGICLLKEEDNEKAKQCFLKCLELENLKESAYNNLSVCYARLCQHEKSMKCILKCLDIDSKKDYYWSQLGFQYKKLNDLENSKNCFLKAIELNPNAINHANYGAFLGDNNNYNDAKIYFEKSLKIDPEFSGPHVDLFHIYALSNRYSHKLWEYYEKRYEVYDQLKWVKNTNIPIVENIKECIGKKCIIFCEQGAGDSVMFLRYLKEIPSTVDFTILCNKDLNSVFKLMKIKTLNDLKGKEKNYDFLISIMSLPYVLKIKNIPKPFFPIKPKKLSFNGNIGICWCGSPAHAHDKHRSTYFNNFYNIFSEKQKEIFKIFSLVKNYSFRKYADQNNVLDYSFGVLEENSLIDLSVNMNSILETSEAIIDNKITLVITVDTMIAHLSASMGIETWLLISKKCDWRWGLKNKSKWYGDNLILFRQEKLDDWNDVFEKIKERLGKRSFIKVKN